ncbi:MAG: sialidase family protein [Nitrososphaera sp.]|uniref:sialidase family protein n=1 Tax=Nitrososphaera sp. TaxID=1971748 RepID=UPI003D6F276E
MKRAALIVAALSAAVLIIVGLSLLSFLPLGKSPPSFTASKDVNNLQNATTATAKFGSVTNLTENPDDSVYGQIAATGDNVHVAWQESISGGNYDIFIKSSRDGGDTFENDTVNLSNNAGFSEHPQLAVSDDNVYVAWTDDPSVRREIFFAKSEDGTSYSEPITLSEPGDSYNVEMTAFGSDVYLVWQANDDAVIFRASHDSGETFDAPVAIADGAGPESFPKVAAYGDAVHIVWTVANESALYHVKSIDRGDTFSKVIKLNGDNAVGEAQVAAYKDDVHVIWGGLHEAKVDDLFYARSGDGGDTFAGPVPIGIKDPLNVELVVMPLSGQQYAIHVASQVALSSENHEILLTSSVDGGRTFAKAANLSNNAGISECPTVSTAGNQIFVSWEDLTTGNHEILYAKGGL